MDADASANSACPLPETSSRAPLGFPQRSTNPASAHFDPTAQILADTALREGSDRDRYASGKKLQESEACGDTTATSWRTRSTGKFGESHDQVPIGCG